MSDILEIAMMILFGISWPLNVIKSLKTRSTKGKSLPGLVFIVSAYLCGIAAKLLSGGVNGFVLFFYILNCTMVSFDLILYFVNYHRERKHIQYENNGNFTGSCNSDLR